MYSRAQRKRYAIVCLFSLAANAIQFADVLAENHAGGSSSSGFRGTRVGGNPPSGNHGTSGSTGSGHSISGSGSGLGTGSGHSLTGSGTGAGSGRTGVGTGLDRSGSGLREDHRNLGVHEDFHNSGFGTSTGYHGGLGIHGGSPGLHNVTPANHFVGGNHITGVGHNDPAFHQAMMHSAGPHWNNYHQAYIGNHPIRLAYAGYHPSYYYHPWYHGPWGGHAWGWGWGYGPGVTFGLAGIGIGIGLGGGWGYPAYYGPYGPYGYWGRPLGWGFGGWGLGTYVYRCGYYPYYNPYYVAGGYPVVVYDYSRPIVVATQAPPSSAPIDPDAPLDNPAFDAARRAFMQGDYITALSNVDAALKRSSTDAVMHEFRSQALFALGDYRQSAAVIHSVLAVGPGWDFTTMTSLYPDTSVYANQLQRLEDYAQEHPRAADVHFLLAYHDMIGSRREAAAGELNQVLSLMPSDRLAKELLMMVQGPADRPPQDPDRSYASAPLPGDPNSASGNAGNQTIPPIDKGLLPGGWNSARDDGSQFRLNLTDDGRFNWRYSPPNAKVEEFSGTYTVEGAVLVLERKEGGALAGTATFDGDGRFNFKMVGAPPEDRGLDFQRS